MMLVYVEIDIYGTESTINSGTNVDMLCPSTSMHAIRTQLGYGGMKSTRDFVWNDRIIVEDPLVNPFCCEWPILVVH
jgi:hypothetical protein